MNTKEKQVQEIMRHPQGSPERWRAAAGIWLRQSEANRLMAAEVIEEVKELKLMQNNDFGVSELKRHDTNSHFRSALGMPDALLAFIEMSDPMVFAGEDGRKNLHKMMRAFPEYCIPRRV